MKPSEDTIAFFIWRYTYLPEHTSKTPKIHYEVIEHYTATERDEFGLLQIFRGAGKTQLSMEYALYCICEGIEPYILFVGATQELANEIVNSAADLATGIPYIEVVRSIDGTLEILNKNKQPAYLVAKSTGSKLRGIAKSYNGSQRQRPTAIVLDDIVSDDIETGAFTLKIHRAIRWLTSALFPVLDPSEGTGRVFGSGTPIRKGDPFLALTEQFGCIKIPLTNTSWPDRFTDKWIANKKSQYEKLGMLRSWKREFELILTDSDTQLFDMNKVRFVDEIPDGLTWFMTCDLAFSEGSGADYSALICNGVDKNGNWFIYPTQGRWKPSETAGKIFELVNRFGILEVNIEQGASFLAVIEHLEQLMADYQNYFNISELKHGGKSKISRISSLEPVINMGRLHIIDVDESEAAESLVEQMELTDATTGCMASHDDLLDALAYQVKVNLYYDEPTTITRADYSRMLNKRR